MSAVGALVGTGVDVYSSGQVLPQMPGSGSRPINVDDHAAKLAGTGSKGLEGAELFSPPQQLRGLSGDVSVAD
ncbi:hypothetical protein MINTM008_23970 [Mycobacterium intracellulare]|nr:hypothetical protein MINTM008_23970 [Mycobacterium intracellulare]BCP42425.1 hypothetical protein MINTMi27_25180 [Mycobacterium intracellulare]